MQLSSSRCASCVDDATGAANAPPPLPADLAPTSLTRAGNYAVAVAWSDGHQSLFPFRSFVDGYADRPARDPEAAAELGT